jgi:hypothetical protein
MIAFHIGAFGDAASATVFFEAELQECDTVGGTYTAVADSDLLSGNWRSQNRNGSDFRRVLPVEDHGCC